MPQQIRFFLKNLADFSALNVSTLASQGDATSAYVIDRKNSTAWLTSGSVDADNTTFVLDFTDPERVTDVFLLQHNFKSFKVEYWDGANYQPFSPAIDETVNASADSHYSVTGVSTSKLRLTVRGTIVANADKTLCQFIATESLGQLSGWPVIAKPVLGKNKRKSGMISGKQSIGRNLGGFAVQLKVAVLSNTADIDIIANLFDSSDGFLVWLGGGDEAQFKRAVEPYRKMDLYVMQCENDFTPEWLHGIYSTGLVIDMHLVEVND